MTAWGSGFDEDEWRVVRNVVNLDRVNVGEIMTAHTMVVAIPVLAAIEHAKALMLDQGHSRLPVYDGTIDQVVGVLFARDLWRADRDGVKELPLGYEATAFRPGQPAGR